VQAQVIHQSSNGQTNGQGSFQYLMLSLHILPTPHPSKSMENPYFPHSFKNHDNRLSKKCGSQLSLVIHSCNLSSAGDYR
jgi:hypothetical protein